VRDLTDESRVHRFMQVLGAAVREPTRIYFTGGVSAVLMGWRRATIDVDIEIVPDRDEVLRVLPRLKEELHVNIELASPAQFLPPLPGWEDRSVFIAREGTLDFHHYDFYAQALAKIERGHARDLDDVQSMLEDGLVEPARLEELHAAIVPELYRYPAVDPASLARQLEQALVGR
jgi:uncharacterized nucleotidyltransferase DUF6036